MTVTGDPALPLMVYTKGQVARLLSVSEREVSRWIASGDLAASRLGPRTIRITLDQLDQFLEQRSLATPVPWPSVPRRGRGWRRVP